MSAVVAANSPVEARRSRRQRRAGVASEVRSVDDRGLEGRDGVRRRGVVAEGDVDAGHAGRAERGLGRGQRDDDGAAGRIGPRAVAGQDADDPEGRRCARVPGH